LKNKIDLIALTVRNRSSIDIKGTQKTLLAIQSELKEVKRLILFDHTKTCEVSGFNRMQNDFSKTLDNLQKHHNFEITKVFKQDENHSSIESLSLQKKDYLVNELVYRFLTDPILKESDLTQLDITPLRKSDAGWSLLDLLDTDSLRINSQRPSFKSDLFKKYWTQFSSNYVRENKPIDDSNLELELELTVEQVILTAQKMLHHLNKIYSDEQSHDSKVLKHKIERLINYAKLRTDVDKSIGIWISDFLKRYSEWNNIQEIKQLNHQLIDYEKFLILLNGAGNCFQRNRDLKAAQLRIIYTFSYVFNLDIKEVGLYTEAKLTDLLIHRNVNFKYKVDHNDSSVKYFNYPVQSLEKNNALDRILDDVRYFFDNTNALNLRNDPSLFKSKSGQLNNNFYNFVNRDIKFTMAVHGFDPDLFSVKSFGRRNMENRLNQPVN
jgi:hypothetical protein